MFVVNIDRPDDEAECEAEESGEDDCPCDWRHDWDWVSPRCSPASYWAVCPPPIIAPWRLSCSLFQQMWRLRVESGHWSLQAPPSHCQGSISLHICQWTRNMFQQSHVRVFLLIWKYFGKSDSAERSSNVQNIVPCYWPVASRPTSHCYRSTTTTGHRHGLVRIKTRLAKLGCWFHDQSVFFVDIINIRTFQGNKSGIWSYMQGK